MTLETGLKLRLRPTNPGIPAGIFLRENGTLNTVGKTPQPISFPFPPVFPFYFLVFLFFSRKRFTVGLDGKRSRSGRDFPIPFSTLPTGLPASPTTGCRRPSRPPTARITASSTPSKLRRPPPLPQAQASGCPASAWQDSQALAAGLTAYQPVTTARPLPPHRFPLRSSVLNPPRNLATLNPNPIPTRQAGGGGDVHGYLRNWIKDQGCWMVPLPCRSK